MTSPVTPLNLPSSVGAHLAGGVLDRFIPEPRSNAKLSFRGVLGGLASVAEPILGGIQSPFLDLLQEQMKWQLQMQLVSLSSNVEKSKHETQMAAIRNIRVG